MRRTLGRSRVCRLSIAAVGVVAMVASTADVTDVGRADAAAIHAQVVLTKTVPSITGTVTDQSSPPDDLGGICVSVLPTAGGTPVGKATTSATNGTYSVKGVSPGTYAVRFTPCATNPSFVYYVTQYYNDESSLDAADPVTVTAGSTESGIDAAMELGGQISGTVTDSSDSPLDAVCVSADLEGGGGGGGVRQSSTADNDQTEFSTTTNSTGQYALDGIPAGQYSMSFVDCGHRGYLPTYASGIGVSPGSTTEQAATMDLPATITGTVTNTAPIPLKGICVAAILNGDEVGGTTTNAEGDYSMSKLYPGSYKVSFTDCHSSFYLEQYYDDQTVAGSDGIEATGNSFIVSPGATVGGINAALEKGGEATGKVTDTVPKHQKATGISGICVEAAPVYDPNDPDYNPPFEYAVTSSKGGYTLSGLWNWSYDITFNECAPENPNYGGVSYFRNPFAADIGVTFHLGKSELPG